MTATTAQQLRRHNETISHIDSNAHRNDEALGRIEIHEAVCAERWQRILERMTRLETIILSAAGTVIVGMGGLLVAILMKGAH